MKDFAVFCPTPSRKREVHSKTGRTFKVDEDRIRPAAAVGRPIIDLTDPITGKVLHREGGPNHVFTESLFSNSANMPNWIDTIQSVWCCLNDSTMSIDPEVPYLFGQTVGYGRASTAGAGTRRGAYNAANQVLAQVTPESVRWLFQYDFTSAQCNGEPIGTIGLTYQYIAVADQARRACLNGYKVNHIDAAQGYTCDGRYAYSCSTAGVVTRHDLWSGSSSVIADVSSITGTTSNTKIVGYAPATGKYYIYVYSGTAGNRKMYEFSDSTFGTLLNTYNVSNFTAININMYIYGNKAFFFSSTSDNRVYSGDFTTNTFYGFTTYSTYNNAAQQENGSTVNGVFGSGSCAYGDKHVYCAAGAAGGNYKGMLFDLSTESIAAYVCSLETSQTNACVHPLTAEKIVCSTLNNNFYHKAAIAAKKLDSPVTKTSANGMTVTYELEVFWE